MPQKAKMRAHAIATQLAVDFAAHDLNEADTRHQVIDPLLHEVLGWPRNMVNCEEYIAPGFADYVLRRNDDDILLLVEAKKSGAYFDLPISLGDGEAGSYVSIKTLLTTPAIRAAIEQVRTYCVDIGCEFGAITNAKQWIFFRTFQKGTDWRTLKAFVIPSLDFFSKRFIDADRALSYTAILEHGSLRKLLLDTAVQNRELFYPKGRITAYSAPVDANQYAGMLRPLADRFFGTFPVEDTDFIDHCYVNDREYDLALSNVRQRLEDEITPYLQSFNVKNFSDAATGGQFANRLSKSLIDRRPSDVVVLFGGKGVGKSTFLSKLLYSKPPQVVKKHAVICLIDLLPNSDIAESIEKDLWFQLIKSLDQDKILEQDRTALQALFADRFELAQKQQLFGLDTTSEYYNIQVNELFATWRSDPSYVASRLANYWKKKHKAPIVVIDNTDQFSPMNQELCFTIAQDVARKLSCLVVISMREERFYASSIHGVLDAYQNAGFHITPPPPRQVFIRRLQYLQKLLATQDTSTSALPYEIDAEVLGSLIRILEAEFLSNKSHLAGFLEACSHGNIRLALELFRGFIVSGYTNIYEITSSDKWILQIHQVIKPFMIPSRFFYDEEISKIPNIYQIRSKAHGSHFTALRILRKLSSGHDHHNAPFISIATIGLDFVEYFSMKDDFELNLDVLLKHRLVESNNRLERFGRDVDSIKITSYGSFILHQLSKTFTYIELICSDCAIAAAETSNMIASLSNEEYRLYTQSQRFERVRKRIQKADIFIRYLESEELRETDLFKLHGDMQLTPAIRTAFQEEQKGVMKSASRINQRGDNGRRPM